MRFELTPEASAAWFPAARSTDMVGVDPGEVHPLTWATAGTDATLPVCLIDLPDGPERGGAGRALWSRHEAGYCRAWNAILSHHLVKIESSDNNARIIRLAEGPVPADRDFELTWKPAVEKAPSVGLFREHVGRADYLLAFVTPPAVEQAEQKPLPREVIFTSM